MIERASQWVVERSLREFAVTTLVGLRQVGKTSLARTLSNRTYLTLDDVAALEAARRDPAGFIAGLPRPVTIDEVQRAPELLLPIKAEIDRRRRNGEFLLTGSAQIELRRGTRETLAGRGSLLRLRPMTWAERARRPEWNAIDALFGCRTAAAVASLFSHHAPFDYTQVFAGGLPFPLLKLQGGARARWFEQYRASYVERDVPPLLQVEEVASFIRFLALAASRTAQTTNYAAIGHEAGISTNTALRWSGVLEATFLVDLLPPYFRNLGKRLVKAPKLHFGDVGLAGHFVGASSWKDATRTHVAGALLETLVAQHFLAFSDTARSPVKVFHYRTQAGAEADFVLARGPRLIPIEVKASATVRSGDTTGLRSFLKDHPESASFGVVLYTGDGSVPLGKDVVAIPLGAVLGGPPVS